MIKVRINLSSMKRFAAVDDHAVVCCLDICSHFLKVLCHNLDTVGFFYTKLSSITDHSGSLCKSSHYSDHRKFVDQGRNDCPLYCGSVERRRADQKICGRLAFFCLVQQGDICPHGFAYTKNTVTGRISSDIFKKDLTVWNKKSGCDKVCGRRNIARNQDFPSVQRRIRFNRSCCSF